MFRFFGREASEILAPWSSIKSVSPALESEVLTTALQVKSPDTVLYLHCDCSYMDILLIYIC